MKPSDIDELLAILYLRLNGYFTTGLIIHSPIKGQSRTDCDCLAVRLPNHSQEDREIESDQFLETKDGITDLIFCEVKHDPEKASFNRSVLKDTTALEAMLRWARPLRKCETAEVAQSLQDLLNNPANIEAWKKGVHHKKVRVRALLCCPRMQPSSSGPWCLTGDVILKYIQKCFSPPHPRSSCSVRYNFEQWTYPLNKIVRLFKQSPKGTILDLKSLYEGLETA